MVSYRILQVDITAHRNREGRVLLPAEPWGVAFLGFDSAEEELIETGSASKKRRAEAELSARQWIERTPGRMALVFSRKTGVVVAQYYRDREGILGLLVYSQTGVITEQEAPRLFGKGVAIYPMRGSEKGELTRVSAILEVERGASPEVTSGRLLHAMEVLRRSQLRGRAVREVIWPADGPSVVPFFWYDGTTPAPPTPPRYGVERYFGLELIVDGLYTLDDECPHRFQVSWAVQIEVCGIVGPLPRGREALPNVERARVSARGSQAVAERVGHRRLWEPRVSASLHSDDYRVSVPCFDATPWFAQARDEQIRALQEEGYGGNYTADSVAELAADYDPQVAQLYTYLEIVNSKETVCGSDCYVNPDEARAWLKIHRPHLLAHEQEGEA